MRLGIFGGSFDPPHVGHLLAASDAYEQLALDKLVFVPAATQPLKAGLSAASAEHRLAMVRLAVQDDARFEVSSVEVDRSGLSFTIETLTHFAAKYPAVELHLLIGADVLDTFGQWREPERIAALARLVVLERSNGGQTVPPFGDEAAVVRLPTRRVDVSSTEIRQRVQAGRSIHGFVPGAVAAYIARAGLYK